MNAVDTNVLAYSVDARDESKRVAALATLESLHREDTVLLWQVACEIGTVIQSLHRVRNLFGPPEMLIRAFRKRFRVVTPGESVLESALEMQATHALSYWDSLLIAACLDAGVTRLYTEECSPSPASARSKS